MQLLGIEPGPMVGKAYKHMLEYRLDNGPVERDVAVAELERWYKEQGEWRLTCGGFAACMGQCEYENPRSRLGERGFFILPISISIGGQLCGFTASCSGALGRSVILSTATQPWMPVIALPAAGTFFVSCRLSNVAPTMTSISWS